MLQTPRAALAKRASKYRLAPQQLDRMLQLLDGRCMVCLRCHAMVIDTTTRAADRRPRGLLCRFCKQRVAIYEGSFGDEMPFYSLCRCRSSNDSEWKPRILAATAQYLDRTEHAEPFLTNQEQFETLIEDVLARGPDPQHVWDGAPVSSLPKLPALTDGPSTVPMDGDRPPLARDRCTNDCRAHNEHVYIACFEKPTKLRDADTHKAVMHYVGWTRQQPPVLRVSQHGPICRESLVAIVPGTEAEEALLKAEGLCPKCDRPLMYY